MIIPNRFLYKDGRSYDEVIDELLKQNAAAFEEIKKLQEVLSTYEEYIHFVQVNMMDLRSIPEMKRNIENTRTEVKSVEYSLKSQITALEAKLK